jgi:hypothetical protein
MRKKLIKAIYDLARDEFETTDDMYMLAIKTDEELVDQLIHIAKYLNQEP